MHVEQAIFTSLKTRTQEGYQLAATSPGVTGEAASELAQWGPGHDSLLVSEPGGGSIDFYALTSGDFCVSRSIAEGQEYSGRAGPRIYTQMLLVPPAVLERFSNNPFAVLEAAAASGQMPVYDQAPATLEPVRLLGRASLVNQLRLAELLTDPGRDALALLVSMATTEERLAVRSHLPLERLLQGLLSLLPLKARRHFSFSTGLRYSARRPVRVVGLPADTAEQRSIERQSGAALFDLTRNDLPAGESRSGWGKRVHAVLEGGHPGRLVDLLRRADALAEEATSLDELAKRLECGALA